MLARVHPAPLAASNNQSIGVKLEGIEAWNDTLKDQTAYADTSEPPNKRRKVVPTNDQVLLIKRDIVFEFPDEDLHASLLEELYLPQKKITFKVDHLRVEDPNYDGSRMRRWRGARRLMPVVTGHNKPEQRLLIISLDEEETAFLGLYYQVSDFTEEALEDLEWSKTVLRVNRHPSKPVTEFQSTSTMIINRNNQGRLFFSLQVQVSVDTANKWSERSIDLIRTQFWELFKRSLPFGKPEMWLSGLDNRYINGPGRVTPRDFYLCTHVPDDTMEVPDTVQHAALYCVLLPFQRRAIMWMLEREGVKFSEDKKTLVPILNRFKSTLPPTVFQGIDKNGDTCYVSHVLGIVSKDLQGLKQAFESEEISRCGILAEEMVTESIFL